MAERFIERVGIMADSGINDIAKAFQDSEMARIKIEAQHCVDWFSLEERRAFLKSVEEMRGEKGLALMKSAITESWDRRKAA